MNFKNTMAGISALGLISALSLTTITMTKNIDNYAANANATSKFGDINSDGYINAVDASIILSYYAYTSTEKGTPMTLEKYISKDSDKTEPTTSEPSDKNVTLRTGGDTFTIVAPNADEVPSLISGWTGLSLKDVDYYLKYEPREITAPSCAYVNFINLNVSGAKAIEQYDMMINKGEDIDVYLSDTYYASRFIDNDTRTAPLSALGITEKDMGEWYPYTKKLAQNSKGEYRAVPYNIAPGAFVYRSDLAKQYLGVTTPEEMQTAIGDWSKFTSSAKTIAGKTNGKVALADSVEGMWQAYSCGRFDYVTSDNKLNLSSDVKAFADMTKELWKCGGVTKNSQWWDNWVQAGQNGECMGYFAAPWALGGFVYDATNKQPGKWSICTGPQAYYWGGEELFVNPKTDNGDDARSFILSSAFNSDNMKQYACYNNMPNNMSVNAHLSEINLYHDKDILDILNAQNYYSVFDQSAISIDIKKYSHYDNMINSDIIPQIKSTYIEKDKSWNDTLTILQDTIHEHNPELK